MQWSAEAYERLARRTMRDPQYIRQREAAWRECLRLGAEPAADPHGYWTAEWEAKMVMRAEAECQARRMMQVVGEDH